MAVSFNLHKSAVENANSKANGLLDEFIELDRSQDKEEPFPSLVEPSETITEQDYSEAEVIERDPSGIVISKYFVNNKKHVGFDAKGCIEFYKTVNTIWKLPAIRKTLSFNFVESALFAWIKNAYLAHDVKTEFMDYLVAEADSIVEKISVWIPISFLQVEEPFVVLGARIETIDEAIVSNWAPKVLSWSGYTSDDAEKYISELRKKHLGKAAVLYTAIAEPTYIFELAIEESQSIVSILGIFSGANHLPDVKCICEITNPRQVPPSYFGMIEYQSGKLSERSVIANSRSFHPWRLNKEQISGIKAIALDNLSKLLTLEKPNNFQKAVSNFVFAYSKVAFTSDPVEKTVYLVSSLESMLLLDENESILQGLAERVAVFTAKDLKSRKKIIQKIKLAYRIRSKYLHYSKSTEDAELVSNFMIVVWDFFVLLLQNVDKFQTREEFIVAIDDHKLS